MTYSPPSTAKPFTLSISDQDLSDCLQLLRLSKLGPTTWENTQTEYNFGVTRQWLSDAKDYWLNTFDWRAQEAYINSFNNYKMAVDGLDIHFIGMFSAKKDAIPIIFMHGWPGSFIEFLPMLEVIKKQYTSKEELPYHIVVPSLPGYTLSSGGPLDRDWTIGDSAKILHQVMLNLGFSKYIAQGGDVGSFEATHMANMYDECLAIHLNLLVSRSPIDHEKLNDLERRSIERAREFQETGSAYQQIHSTKPATIGHAVTSNPLSLLAWIGEKFLDWSDTDPSLDHIILNIALYWFTGSFPRSIYPYRQLRRDRSSLTPAHQKPTGVSFFARELFPMIEAQLKTTVNLVQYKQHEHGGHFAALEEPEALWGDVEEFVGVVWKGSAGAKL